MLIPFFNKEEEVIIRLELVYISRIYKHISYKI